MPETPTAPATAPAGPVFSYDEVPYESHPFAQTHPDRMATVASLFGLNPPPVATCRVLELGCAAGGNITPLAEAFPESRLIGLDLSARQIADGQKIIERLGRTNVELRHASILDVDESYGQFDYVICHGVYSWVPPRVQDKILEICRDRMTPSGVAYISYNTYPGWHMRGMIRDMMRYHASRFEGPVLKTRQARALLDFLAQSVPQNNTAYSVMLKGEVETLRKQADHYLFHEHLEEVNEPLYFHQFAERAQAKGLKFLGEARIGTMVTANFGPEVERTLRTVAQDLIQMEQYMDFVRNRMFRESLLVHAPLNPNYTIYPEGLRRLYVASPARPVNEPIDIHATDAVPYRGPSGYQLSTSAPLLKAAMLVMRHAWPAALPFDDLHLKARALLKPADNGPAAINQERHLLGVGILNCYTSSDLVELHALPMPFVREIRDTPVVSPLARLQAETSHHVTNRRHEVVRLGDFDRHVAQRLDGNRGRMRVVEELEGLVRSGTLVVQEQEKPISDPQKMRMALTMLLDQSLNMMAYQALLVG